MGDGGMDWQEKVAVQNCGRSRPKFRLGTISAVVWLYVSGVCFFMVIIFSNVGFLNFVSLGLPIPIVVVSVGLSYDKYGIKSDIGERKA